MDETKLKLFEEVFMQSFSPTVITDANLSVGCHVLFANPAFCNKYQLKSKHVFITKTL